MSWTGIKKAINRAGTQVMLKTGAIEETVDLEYDYEEKRFRNMETNLKLLQKQVKHYLDSLKILSNSQANIGEVLNSFYGNSNEEIENLAQLYNQSLKEFNLKSIQELEDPYYQTVINPICRFNSYYIEINEAIKKRNHKKLDYDAMKNKLKKTIEKPTNEHELKLTDYQNQLDSIESTYNDLNSKLKQELPKLINLRIPYIDPSFESFVKIQLRFFNENYQFLNQIQSKLDSNTRKDYINGNLDEKLDNVLDKMRELNITSV
ncbi:hypothetical protein HYPBUDRAFT_111973 [Hyphopichia burtonii NRRL Y-1933]|uniref:BAR domain-containing protein n=1 Tax=Hyphopichia burtonii NRRL Y-1933 TaxID=984485 RepID=A0A1E4RFZ5_9ASCO|nr:hypothetical protein HYPBUDRAFT_111973 [Hyphopichia burtonii NRRL Y-1933]ODV66168.1 hypothetical protein HYPBUDRAFT_111973 [Hyphopichia burtonii NRRL Y-1933]